MSTYLIGDIHGCYKSFKKMLHKVSFNPQQDILWLTGDLVAKGPYSLEVLNFVYNIKNSVKIVLGNHDLNLLKLYTPNINNHNCQYKKKYINHTNIFQSRHANKLINWLRHQPILQIDEEKKIVMTHAGIIPTWTIHAAKKYAKEIETILKNKYYSEFLHNIDTIQKTTSLHNLFNIPSDDLIRIAYNINIFTKMRYLFPNGKLDMQYKDIPQKTPFSLQPWFTKPGLILPHYNIIFGHWSTLEGQGMPNGIYGLDTGCYRGKRLTMLQWENKQLIHISCDPHAL